MISVMIVIIISNDRILIASIIVNVDIIIIESTKSRLYFSFFSKLLFGKDPVGFGIYHWNDWDCNQLAR